MFVGAGHHPIEGGLDGIDGEDADPLRSELVDQSCNAPLVGNQRLRGQGRGWRVIAPSNE